MRCAIGLLLLGLACTQRQTPLPAPNVAVRQQALQVIAAHEAWPPPLAFSYVPHATEDAYVAREYTTLDAELRESFDFASRGRVRFHWVRIRKSPPTPCDPEGRTELVLRPTPHDVLGRAEAYVARIDALSWRQPSPPWMVRLAARRGSVYESVWLALRDTPSPFTAAQRKTIEDMRTSGRDEVVDLADDIEARVRRPDIDVMQASAEEAIGTYAWTLAFAAKMNVHDLDDDLRSRLATFATSPAYEIIVNAPPPPGMASAGMRLMMKDIPNLR